jgi:ABC-2 type transport system ATP-binding protein
MNPAIQTDHLTKHYGDVAAVEDLSLHVERGEVYAFLGLNGAGKTTTIRLLLGLVKPTHGEARVLGTRIEPGRRGPWDAVGHLVEAPYAYPELTVRENLEAIRRLRPGVEPQAVLRIIERMGLGEYANRRAGTLSQGNAQRLGLAKALMHDPTVLLLDEPANGLDPAGIVEIRRLLGDLAHRQGVTVFVSSHILGEVARLADRIGVIHQGRLLQEMEAGELERRCRRKLLIGARDPEAAYAVLAAAGHAANRIPGGQIEATDDDAIEHPDAVATLLVNAGHAPMHLAVQQEELEQYFLRLVGVNPEAAT